MKEVLEAQPELPVADLNTAVSFYRQLGFEPIYRNGSIHQVMRNGGVTIHLSTLNRGGTASCQILVGNVDGIYEKVLAIGADVIYGGISDREWGFRDFTMKDPDGNLITFSQAIHPSLYR